MEHLFNQLKQAVENLKAKTQDTKMVWVGDAIDFVNLLDGRAGSLIPIEDSMYLILVDDDFILFNKGELTEDLVDEIKQTLGI